MLPAQSNDMMDRFLSQEEAGVADSLLLIALANELVDAEATEAEIMSWLETQEWGKKLQGLRADDGIQSGHFHIALFESFGIKGGMMYSLFKTPRYAAHEASYQGFMTGTPYVNHIMTPDEVLASLSMALEMKEEEQ